MKTRISKNIFVFVLFLIVQIFILTKEVPVYAEGNNSDTRIVVSLGDSYSSGESIEPFYDQDLGRDKKVKSEDWISHRSQLSWPGQLRVPGMEGTLADNKDCYWYFEAISGATTWHLKNSFRKVYSSGHDHTGYTDVPAELSIFDILKKGKVDYVTLSLGGNDIDFTGVVTQVVTCPDTIMPNSINKKIEKLWTKFYEGDKDTEPVKESLKQAYKDISNAAGEQATILVAGYPELFEKTGKGGPVSQHEATVVNKNVKLFNTRLNEIITDARDNDNVNAYFIPIDFSGHEAYSDDPWINPVIFGSESQDIQEYNIASAYSMHPNAEGAKKYAEEVQKYINSLEEGSITFSIEDEDGNSLSDVKITTTSSFDTQSEEYNYSLETLENLQSYFVRAIESATITFEKDGYKPVTITVSVGPKEEVNYGTITLEKEESSSYTWVVEPEIEADDMFLVRQTGETRNGAYYYNSCAQFENEYTVVKKGNTLDLIDQNGNLVTNWNLSSAREYGNYEVEFIDPVDLTGNISTTYPQFDTQNVDRAFFFGSSSDYQYGNVEHADPGYTEFYYSVDDTLCCSYSTLYASADIEPPHMVGVPQSETMYDASDTNFYSNIAHKFAIFTGNVKQTDFIYDACGGEEDGLMAVSQNGKWGYIDQNGRVIIPIEYDASWGYCVADGIGNTKNTVTCSDTAFSSEFRDACYAPSDGYINLVKDGEWELRDLQGELIIAPGTFEQILPVYNGKCWVKQDGKWGLIQIGTEDEESDSYGVPEEQTSNQDANAQNSLNREKFTISSVYDISALRDHESFFIKGTVDSSPNEDVYLYLDGNTQFDSSCDMQYFSNYQDGDIPQDWFRNNYWDALTDSTNTALLGVYDISVTDSHIDTIYGLYWWD